MALADFMLGFAACYGAATAIFANSSRSALLTGCVVGEDESRLFFAIKFLLFVMLWPYWLHVYAREDAADHASMGPGQ